MNNALIPMITNAARSTEAVLVQVAPDRFGLATPCPALDLEALTAHLVGGLDSMVDVADGKPLTFGPDPDVAPHGAAAAFRRAADRLIERFSAPGVLQQTFTMPWGQTTGAQLAGFELIEIIVHGWDIARAAGVDGEWDEEIVAATLQNARTWVDSSARTPQLFGPEVAVPAGASGIDALVAFLGREPGWSPTSAAA
jgi:uncharacterized protein (TIGR03086 family)